MSLGKEKLGSALKEGPKRYDGREKNALRGPPKSAKSLPDALRGKNKTAPRRLPKEPLPLATEKKKSTTWRKRNAGGKKSAEPMREGKQILVPEEKTFCSL